MAFLLQSDVVLSAILSKPVKQSASETTTDAVSGGGSERTFDEVRTKTDKTAYTSHEHGELRTKVKIRKAGDIYRTETTAGTQVFHGKLERAELDEFLAANIPAAFKNAVIETTTETITILANKKGKCTVLRKKKTAPQQEAVSARNMKDAPLLPAEMLAAAKGLHLSQPHDRQKNYLLKEGTPVSFLVRLGIMTKDGKVHAQKYSKFRQINRFLEYVDDILPELTGRAELTVSTARTEPSQNPACSDMARAESPSIESQPSPGTHTATSAKPRALEIVDFGCGKSYLTFAVFYYLTAIKGLKAHITGIDLKKDVIAHCKQLASDCGYKGMEFICGDVADFKGSEHPDLVITLHACDTATDYALSYAVKNEAKCILSVPCCQHELNSLTKKRVPDDAFSALFKYGIIKERLSALATDVMRAELLEKYGYSTQILEFIDMEDTPKNLLIRAVKRNQPAHNAASTELDVLKFALGQTITLEKLLNTEE